MPGRPVVKQTLSPSEESDKETIIIIDIDLSAGSSGPSAVVVAV